MGKSNKTKPCIISISVDVLLTQRLLKITAAIDILGYRSHLQRQKDDSCNPFREEFLSFLLRSK